MRGSLRWLWLTLTWREASQRAKRRVPALVFQADTRFAGRRQTQIMRNGNKDGVYRWDMCTGSRGNELSAREGNSCRIDCCLCKQSERRFGNHAVKLEDNVHTSEEECEKVVSACHMAKLCYVYVPVATHMGPLCLERDIPERRHLPRLEHRKY